MPFLDLRAIKEESTLKLLLDKIGWRAIWSQAGQLRGACPVHVSHSKRSRSFAVNGDSWYCHKCKIGGDVFDLWRALHPNPLYEAVCELVAFLGTNLYYQRRQLWSARPGNGEEER